MCLAEPGRVVSIDGTSARVATIGGPIDVSLTLLGCRADSIGPGDWLIVVAGAAVKVISDRDVPVLLNERRLHREVPDAPGPVGTSEARVASGTTLA